MTDAMHRTFGNAISTGGTFFIINAGKIVDDVNSVRRTTLFTFFTTNTGDSALLASNGAFFLVTAGIAV